MQTSLEFVRAGLRASQELVGGTLEWPFPAIDVGAIDAELIGMFFAGDLLIEQGLANICTSDIETRYPVNGINRQAEAVGLITDREFQRRVDVSLLFVAAHVKVVLARSTVDEAMDEPRVSMKVEHYWLIRRENGLELTVRQAVRVLGARNQFEEIHDVDEADLYVR